jgi:hypothetical protein
LEDLMNMLSFRSYFAMVLLAWTGGCSATGELEEPSVEVGAAAEALRWAPEVPDVIKLPDGNRLAFYLDAEGVQIYECRASATAPSGFAWSLLAPDADLFKPNGRPAGTHYAGPTWEYLDGSTVVAARVSSYVDDPASIPWLLLSATSHTGTGKMSKVSFIHRLYTSGGIAPGPGCDADHVGAQTSVDYTTTYYFYEPKADCGN